VGEEIGGGDLRCEALLAAALLKIADRDGYYYLRDIKKKMAEMLGEEPNWLNEEWIGNALKRLGFLEKRRLSRGRQVRLTPKLVNAAASKLLPPEVLAKIYGGSG
jgi:hypothetical protein